MVPVPAALQHADGVDRGDEEAADEVGGDQHVRRLVGPGVVEDHLQRIDVHHLAGAVQREPGRLVHPGVGGDHRERAADAGDDDRHPGPEVRPRPQPLPPEDVERDEDRLDEEEQPFDRERDPEGRPPGAHELRPQEPELERQDRARDGADGERDGHVLRPALGQQHERVLVVPLDRPPVGHQGHEGPRHAQRDEDDVAGERERHLRRAHGTGSTARIPAGQGRSENVLISVAPSRSSR